MRNQLKSKPLVFALVLAFATSVASCGSSEVAAEEVIETSSPEPVVEDLAIRDANCKVLAAWDSLFNSAGWENMTKNFNSYDHYAFMEKELWQKIKEGDPSHEALMQLREISYAQDYFRTPPMGSVILMTEYDKYSFKDFPYTDEQEWAYIREVNKFCTQVPEKRLAEDFAAALLI
jgi:hypothetical protein